MGLNRVTGSNGLLTNSTKDCIQLCLLEEFVGQKPADWQNLLSCFVFAVHSFGTLGKGFDEAMPHNDNEFLVKTIENVEEKMHFLSFFGEKLVFP
jgi:hypothetical protein